MPPISPTIMRKSSARWPISSPEWTAISVVRSPSATPVTAWAKMPMGLLIDLAIGMATKTEATIKAAQMPMMAIRAPLIGAKASSRS